MIHPKPSYDLTQNHMGAVSATLNWFIYVALDILERKTI